MTPDTQPAGSGIDAPVAHAIVGITCDNRNGYYYPVDGRKYYYLNLTAPGLSLGQMGYGGP